MSACRPSTIRPRNIPATERQRSLSRRGDLNFKTRAYRRLRVHRIVIPSLAIV